MKRLCLRRNNKGQATAELAIMGSIVIMLLAYLLQQGYIYNARQSLEMYTFREALARSKNPVPGDPNSQYRGITLTVIRDVISPSFFTGLNRQRLMATSSVDYNPWIMYGPTQAQDLPTKYLLQVGEAMVRNKLFFEVPPTKVKVVTKANEGQDEVDQWQWENSAVREIDPQMPDRPENEPMKSPKTSTYSYASTVKETTADKIITKDLSSADKIPTVIAFEDLAALKHSRMREDWTAASDDSHIKSIDVQADTVPDDVRLTLQETVLRDKTTTTPH